MLLFAFGKSETVTVPEGGGDQPPGVLPQRCEGGPASVREVAVDAFRECGNLARLRLELPESAPGWAEVYFPELRGHGRNGMREQ